MHRITFFLFFGASDMYIDDDDLLLPAAVFKCVIL